MLLIFLLVKIYIIFLMLRYVATSQELMFNPVGRAVAFVTNPMFNKFKVPKEQSDRYIPVMIIISIALAIMLDILFTRSGILYSVFSVSMNFLLFFMLFFIVSVLLGSRVNKPYVGTYIMYFFRIGLPWVKFTKMIVPITSGKIIYPAIFIIFLIYVCLSFIMAVGIQISFDGLNLINPLMALRLSVKTGLLGICDILHYLSWLIIIRAFMSWINPDTSNPIVQLIFTIAEPVLSPFKRFIPNLGILDFSAFAAVIALSVIASAMQILIKSVL